MRKIAKNKPNMAPRPPRRSNIKNSPACAMPCLAPNLESKKISHYLRWSYLTRGGEGPPRIVTLRGSARGSILENLPEHGQIMLSISKICPLCVQKVQNPPKFLPNPPQTFPKPFQSDPKSIQKPFWSPFGANA